MAAAAVAGLIPVLHSVAGDKSGYYIGRQLWFGLIALYGVVVYVVRMPWAHIHEDFWCHGNITYPCLIECFEKNFSNPVMGIWYFFFFIFATLFFLMEFFMAQIRHKQVKMKSMDLVHLPLVTQAVIHCSTYDCPGPYLCLIRATMEKRMSIYTLITLSFLIIVFCTGFFMYSIHHYLLKGISSFKFWMN
nr:uncharacterized protein LOC105861877 isoform X2 [Microcebus murinus]